MLKNSLHHTFSKTLVFVLYDGIANPVFAGQVLTPILHKLATNEYEHAHLISFEQDISPASTTQLLAFIQNNILYQQYKHKIQITLLKRYRFVTQTLLYPEVQKLKTWFSNNPIPATIIARGQLAGYIVLKAAPQNLIHSLIIQHRGLLAAEHEYVHNNAKWPLTWLHTLRTYQYTFLEKQVCRLAAQIKQCLLEVVSPAMGDYLTQYYGALQNMITVAQADIPPAHPVSATEQQSIRAALGITEHAYVYCYNGSAKPWQCPQETIAYFEHQYAQNKNAFLLVITTEKATFSALLTQTPLPAHAYAVINVPYHAVYKHVAACDAGILFRKAHVMNYVSRPTKALEYAAAGLIIVHNGTVAYVNGMAGAQRV